MVEQPSAVLGEGGGRATLLKQPYFCNVLGGGCGATLLEEPYFCSVLGERGCEEILVEQPYLCSVLGALVDGVGATLLEQLG